MLYRSLAMKFLDSSTPGDFRPRILPETWLWNTGFTGIHAVLTASMNTNFRRARTLVLKNSGKKPLNPESSNLQTLRIVPKSRPRTLILLKSWTTNSRTPGIPYSRDVMNPVLPESVTPGISYSMARGKQTGRRISLTQHPTHRAVQPHRRGRDGPHRTVAQRRSRGRGARHR